MASNDTTGLVTSTNDTSVPQYIINLALPPKERYKHVAMNFKSQAAELPALFDEIVRDFLPTISIRKVRLLSCFALRRVHGREENEELQGISEVIGIDMWLLVAFNVLLDLFMGCTSGGVKVEYNDSDVRMLHFRTLDWGMDPLRKMTVHLDFVEKDGGEVIASSLGYLGYVGILTGVRKGLSMSLNFRPNHNSNDRIGNLYYYSHIVLVLLGVRPSISSMLRRYLLPSSHSPNIPSFLNQDLDSIGQNLPCITTTAAYLTFSDGDRTLVIEKDNSTALVRSADDFIVVTNHDAAEEITNDSRLPAAQGSVALRKAGMEEIVEESMSRKDTIVQLWEKSQAERVSSSSKEPPKPRKSLKFERVIKWIDKYPITNEETHFAAILDPKAGKVVWAQRYIEPEWIQA
ncbi:hypothetical protein ACLMJK_001216 [Lecanora helva]